MYRLCFCYMAVLTLFSSLLLAFFMVFGLFWLAENLLGLLLVVVAVSSLFSSTKRGCLLVYVLCFCYMADLSLFSSLLVVIFCVFGLFWLARNLMGLLLGVVAVLSLFSSLLLAFLCFFGLIWLAGNIMGLLWLFRASLALQKGEFAGV